jgi:hypothetical protein
MAANIYPKVLQNSAYVWTQNYYQEIEEDDLEAYRISFNKGRSAYAWDEATELGNRTCMMLLLTKETTSNADKLTLGVVLLKFKLPLNLLSSKFLWVDHCGVQLGLNLVLIFNIKQIMQLSILAIERERTASSESGIQKNMGGDMFQQLESCLELKVYIC